MTVLRHHVHLLNPLSRETCVCVLEIFLFAQLEECEVEIVQQGLNSASCVSNGYDQFIASVRRLQRWSPSHVACDTTRLFSVGVYEKCHVWMYCVGDQHMWTQQIAVAVGAVTAELLRCVDCKSSARHLVSQEGDNNYAASKTTK